MLFVPLILAATNMRLDGMLSAECPMLSVLMFRYRFRYRTTPFEAALPIAGRDLFLARAFSNLVFVWLTLPVLVLVILLRAGLDWGLILGLVEGAAVLSLVVVLPLTARVRELTAPGWMVGALCAAAAIVGVAALHFLPRGATLAVFLLSTAAAIGATWSSVPPGFQVAPPDAVAAPKPFAERHWRRSWGHGVTLILRHAIPWQLWFFPLALLLLGAFGTGFYFMTIYAFQGTLLSHQRTRWMRALPLSHRALLAVTLAVIVLPLVGATAMGTYFGRLALLAPRQSVGTGPIVVRNSDDEWQRTNVPLEYWRYAPGVKAPAITAPWGETAQPPALSILGFQFYNPYFTSPANSRQFVDWQFENATQAMHGRRISPAQYHALSEARLPLPTDQARVQILCLAALLVYSMFLVWLCELIRWHWLARPGNRVWKISIVGLLGLPALTALATDMYHLTRDSTQVLGPLTTAALLHISQLLSSNVWLVTFVAAIPVLAMYSILEWQFRRSEMTGMVNVAPGR